MNKERRKATNRLRKTYWIALSIIAVSILVNYVIVNDAISNLVNDSSIINQAGRQRMLSQKLVKELILLGENIEPAEVQKTLQEWTSSHEELSLNNSSVVDTLFHELNPEYDQLVTFTNQIIAAGNIGTNTLEVLNVQESYLNKMEDIVFQYEYEALEKVRKLRRIEKTISGIALGVLVFELFFLFMPASRYIRNLVTKLKVEQDNYKGIAEENKVLLEQSESALRELKALNFALDQTALFASLKIDGETLFISSKFKDLLEIEKSFSGIAFYELITNDEKEQAIIKDTILVPRSEIWTEEIQVTTKSGKVMELEMSVIPINKLGVKQSILVLCNNLTKRKIAEAEVTRLSEMNFNTEMDLQKQKAIQVLEAQEEERKRIAKDMHDGIGQMLTALKFNLESVNLSKPEKAAEKLSLINRIAGDLIRGVRIATFNLTPPELGDYGIKTGLSKMAETLSSLSGMNILFIDKSDSRIRFNFNTEINMYRIAQEAVNNAIKYSQADHIVISCSTSPELFSLVVDDDGNGFDMDSRELTSRDDGSGMGLNFMKERASYIDGRIFISSSPGQGTKVTLNVPIDKNLSIFTEELSKNS